MDGRTWASRYLPPGSSRAHGIARKETNRWPVGRRGVPSLLRISTMETHGLG